MKSGISCFKTLFLSAVRRSWPVWTAYLIIWLIYLCGGIASGLTDTGYGLYWSTEYVTVCGIINKAAGMGVFISFFAAIASTMCVFSFMYSARAAGAMASLPIRREKLYLAQVLAGLMPLLCANLIVFATGLGIEASFGQIWLQPLLCWLAIVSMQLVIFFGIAVLCAQLTGHIVVLPVAYVILNLTASVLEYAVYRALNIFVYGVSPGTNVLTALSPPVYMATEMFVEVPSVVSDNGYWVEQYGQAHFVGWTGMLAYLAVGVVLILLGMLLYKHRRMESSGDVVSVRMLKPVFKYCFALGGALVLGVVAFIITNNSYYTDGSVWTLLLLMLLGGFICYFAAEMMIKKTFHVWKARTFAGFAVFAVVFALLTCAVEYDLFGYEAHVPEADRVESVRIDYDDIELFERENIESVIELHRRLISHKAENESALGSGEYLNDDMSIYGLTIEYRLDDGKTLKRRYSITSPQEDLQAYEDILNCQEAINSRAQTQIPVTEETIGYADVSYYDPETSDYDKYRFQSLTISPQEAYELYIDCILPDMLEGTLGRTWLIMDEEYYQSVYDCYISLELRQPSASGIYSYDYLNVVPTVDSRRTNAWLEEHGITPVLEEHYLLEQDAATPAASDIVVN